MASATNEGRKRLADKLSCTLILNVMVIIGFMFNYMLRVNISIAILEMAVPEEERVRAIESAAENGTVAVPYETADNKFHWDKYAQNDILGSFFWGYILTELPGGRLAEIIGARKVFGGGMLMASLLTLLIPAACHINVITVAVLRGVLGFFLGATWPAIPPMAAKWIPPMERSKFIANMMASSLGAALTMPVCGVLIAAWGWPSVFYITGAVGVVWSILWFLLIFDSPATHPRISEEERTYIETKIADGAGSNAQKPSRVPWLSILCSMPVWAIVITHACSVFGYFVVVNQLPTYLKEVFSLHIQKNGLLSSLPYLGKYAMAVAASYVADRLRRSKRLSTTMTRKVFTTFAVFTPGLLMMALALWGRTASVAIAMFTTSLFFNGAVTAGYLANGLDIAPNFSGTIFGMANTLSSIGGYLSTKMVAALTHDNHTVQQWNYVFWILAGIYMFGSVFYLIFGTGNMQSWNNAHVRRTSENGSKSRELQPLKNGVADKETLA